MRGSARLTFESLKSSRRGLRAFSVATVIFAISTMSADAKTYVVNPEGTGDFPTIQAAIDASVDGDIVQLEDGVYFFTPNQTLHFSGREITLESQSGSPEQCVLNGDAYNGDAIAIGSGVGPGCIVRGLTITGFGHLHYPYGGGLIISSDSSPTIENCRIVNCRGVSGAAFAISDGAPSFRDCLFAGNLAEAGGGGLVKDGAVVSITRCLFLGNRSTEGSLGGALGVGDGSQVTLTECTIAGNTAANSPNSNGGIFIAPGLVGGTAVHLVRSILWGNCGLEAYAWNGGAITFECSVVDSADVLNLNGIVTYLTGNVFTSPLFCGQVSCHFVSPTILGDYTVDSSSPALLAPCGPIGALGEGCSTVSIEEWSWGRIKGVYRVGAGGP